MTVEIINGDKLKEYIIVSDFYDVYHRLLNIIKKGASKLDEQIFKRVVHNWRQHVCIIRDTINAYPESKNDAIIDNFSTFVRTIFKYDTPRNKQYLEFGKLGMNYWFQK